MTAASTSPSGRPVRNRSARRPLRLGLAGLSHDHISIVANLAPADFEIVGVCDRDQALLTSIGGRFGVREDCRFADVEAMVVSARPDAVAAFGPIFDHLSVVEVCAPAGVHVMVEKPLAVSADHASRIVRVAENYGIHILTNYETTWYPSSARVLRDVRNGVIGALRKVLVRAGHAGPIESGCQPQFLAWLTDPALSGGGALTDFGCYGVNIATFLAGGRLPDWVTAVTRTFKPALYEGLDDDATIVLDYANFEVVIEASWNWPYQRKDIEIHGDGGSLIATDAETVWLRRSGVSGAHLIVPRRLSARRAEPFAFFAAVLRGEEKLASSDLSALANNLTVVRVLDAARRSAAAKQAVRPDGAFALGNS